MHWNHRFKNTAYLFKLIDCIIPLTLRNSWQYSSKTTGKVISFLYTLLDKTQARNYLLSSVTWNCNIEMWHVKLKGMLISKTTPESVVRTAILPNLSQVFHIINDKKIRVQMPRHITFPEPHMVTVEKGIRPSCWGAVDKMHLHELHFSVGSVYNIYR